MAGGTGVGQGKMKNEVGNIKVVSVVSLSGSSGRGQPHPATFWTRKCACCCSTIATNYGSIIPGRPSQPLAKPTVHEMLSTIFCYPRDLTTEEELQCCSKCTLLMQQGFAWSQALKKVLSVESKIHSLLEIIQKQNLSIRRVMSVPVTTAFDSGHQPTTNTTEAGTSTGMPTPLNVIRIQKRKQCHPVSTITPVSTLNAPTTTTSTITQTTNSFSIRLPPTQKFIKYQNVVATTMVSPKGPSFSEEKQDRKTGTGQEKKEVRPWKFQDANDVVALSDSDNEPETDPFTDDADGVRQDPLASTPEDSLPPKGKRVRPAPGQQTSTVGCCVDSCDAKFNGPPSDGSDWLKDHMETIHPYLACCELCESDVYGKDEQATRELLVKHHSERHASTQNPIPAPTLETVTTYPVYTKIYSCTCQICHLRFHSSLDHPAAAKLRKAHTISQHKTSRQCPQCPTVLKGDPSTLSFRLRQHIDMRHKPKPKFICEICERPLPNSGKVRMIHTMTHMNKEEREAEIEKNPSIRKTTLCPICGLVLQSKTGASEEHILKNHMRVHSETTAEEKEKRMYPCDQCDYSSTDRRSSERHKLIHVEGAYCKFTCERCGKGYVAGQGKEYKYHIMVCCDEKERPVQCPEPGCFKRFKLKQAVMHHIMLCHKKTPEDARGIMYPGLPVPDWVRTTTMPRKWKGKRKGKEEEGNSGDASQFEELPEVPVEMEMEEDGNPLNVEGIARRSVRNRDKMMRLDL